MAEIAGPAAASVKPNGNGTVLELEAKQLKPYVSVKLYDLRTIPFSSDALSTEMDFRIQEVLKAIHGIHLRDSGPVKASTSRGWTLRGHWHSVGTSPPWLAELKSDAATFAALVEPRGSRPVGDQPAGKYAPILLDVRHHLTLFLVKPAAVLRTDGFAVLLSTDSAVRIELAKQLDSIGVAAVSIEDLGTAFLRGASRQAWLKGVHKPVTVKPDAKALIGLDLRNVFDPFGDQSFRLEAAISDHRVMRIVEDFRNGLNQNSPLRNLDPEDAIGRPPKHRRSRLVGFSMSNGVIWTRSTQKIGDFLREIDSLCEQLSSARREKASMDSGYDQPGYRILVRAQSASLAELGDAIDFSIDIPLPGEAGADPNTDPEVASAQDIWLEEGAFVPRPAEGKGERLMVDAYLSGQKIAVLRVQPILRSDGTADLDLSVRFLAHDSDQNGSRAGANFVSDVFSERNQTARSVLDHVLSGFAERTSMWFSKGYSIQSKRLFALKFRDVPFERWGWLPFSQSGSPPKEYRLDVEKPAQARLWEVSWDGNSLFEFIVNNRRTLFPFAEDAYLLCDDGSGEMADFIFFNPGMNHLRLVHVKAAGEAEEKGIAPAKYEQVISQATKNLRFLDTGYLLEVLEKRPRDRSGELTWDTNGKCMNRVKAIEALKRLGRFIDRGVIVLQPHTSRAAWEEAERELRAGSLSKSEEIQLLRLRTMLADFEDVCRRFEASFEAWGVNDSNCPDAGALFARSALL